MPPTLTVIVLVVAPVLHFRLPAQLLAVNVADSPVHKVFLLVMMIGATGLVPVLITRLLLMPLSPQVLLQVAV